MRRERLQPLQHEEAIGRADAAPEVAQPLDTSTCDEGGRAEGLTVDEPVVTGAGLGEVGELTIRPVELSRVNDRTAHRGTVAAEVLRQRIDDDIRAVLDGLEEDRRQRVIHHQREAMCMGDIGYGTDVDEVQLGVPQRLGVD